MSKFKRGLGPLLGNLKNEELFKNKLKKDVENKIVFFAIRGGECSFYLSGCTLFTYKNFTFSTHQEYGFVSRGKPKDYITEFDLAGMEIEDSFENGYEKIKKRTELFAKVEAKGVSELYKFSAPASDRNEQYFLVDIEVALSTPDNYKKSDKERTATNQIDILLYDNTNRKLLFCEAKHFSNQEIWPGKTKHDVIGQLDRYNRLIAKHKNDILDGYAKAFDEYNELFKCNLQPPQTVHDKCGLLIFGFNTPQRERLKSMLKAEDSFLNHNYKIIGDIGDNAKKYNTVKTVFKELSK